MMTTNTKHCLLVPKNQHQYEFFLKIKKRSDSKIKFFILDIFNLGDSKQHFIVEAPIFGGSVIDNANCKKYLLPNNINKYLYSDRELSHFQNLYRRNLRDLNLLKLASGINDQIGELLSKQKIDFVFGEFITGLVDGLLFEQCVTKNIPFYSIRQSKVFPGIIVGLNNSDHPYIVNEKANLSAAHDYIDDLRTKYLQPAYLEKTANNHKFNLNNLADLAHRFQFMRKIKSHSKFRHFLNPLIWAWFKLKNRLILKLKRDKYFESNVGRLENYILFPLHYEPEASVTIRGFPYDQLDIIKYISRSLPPDMTLLVKEHKGNQGYRPISHYKKISRLHNAILASPDAEPYSLIKNASAIATFSGRMGMEAAVLGKPVLLFGDVFYSNLSTVQIVEKITDLTTCLSDLDNIKSRFDYSQDKAKLMKYCNGVFDGNFVMKSDNFNSEKNVSNVMEVLKIISEKGC